MPNMSDVAKNLGIKSKKDLAAKLAEQGVPKEAVTDENLKEVNKAVRGSAVVAQQGQDPTKIAVSELKAADPASIDEKPKEEKPKNLAGQQAIYAALAAAIPTVLGAAFGGAEGGAIGARAGGASAKEFLGGIEKQKQEENKLAAMAAEKEKEKKEYALKERGVNINEQELGIKRGELASKHEENRLKAEENKIQALAAGAKDTRDFASKLRSEYVSNPVTKASQQVATSYRNIQSTEISPAGDISLVYNFMKMNDPGSTVREGEYATAENAAGIPTQIRTQYNKILSGQKLAPSQRADFRKQAGNLYQAQAKAQKELDDYYSQTAGKYQIDPSLVLTQMGLSPQPGPGGMAPLAKKDLTIPTIQTQSFGSRTPDEIEKAKQRLAEIQANKSNQKLAR